MTGDTRRETRDLGHETQDTGQETRGTRRTGHADVGIHRNTHEMRRAK